MGSKMGRPYAENPLNHDLKVRIDDDTYVLLERYSEKNQTNKAAVIRSLLVKFLSKQK